MTVQQLVRELEREHGPAFERKVAWQVELANNRIRGEGLAPWEVVMAALFVVERRRLDGDDS
jgi:hypothetical protein